MTDKKRVPEQVQEQLLHYYQHGWQELFDKGQEMQEAVLLDILELGRESAYARDHGFAGVRSREEFLAKAPVSDYEDYRAYVTDNMREDNGQLTSLPSEYYLVSTGISGRGKFFAENRLGALARQLSIDIWNMILTQKVPVMTNPNVRMLAVTNCSPLEEAPNGKAVRRTSSQAAKGLWERNPQMYVFPYEFLEAQMSNDDRDYLTALYTLKEKHFNMLFCNNLAYFGVVLDWIARAPQQMIDDIRTGHMTAALTDADRAILEAGFAADETRAAELQSLLDAHGTLPVEAIWPDFIFVGAWLAGSVGRLAKDVMRRLPARVQYISESYGASEGMFNIPMDFNCAWGPLAPYSCYFEFLPLDGGPIVDMRGVEDGKYYEMVITTYSGLYRYNLHDIVVGRGFTGTTANIEFCCRGTDCWQASGQTVYGYELAAMVEEAEAAQGVFLSYFQGYAEDGKLSLVAQPSSKPFDAAAFYGALAEILRRRGIEAGRLYVMSPEYCGALFASYMQEGRTVQTIKLPLVVQSAPAESLTLEVYPAQ